MHPSLPVRCVTAPKMQMRSVLRASTTGRTPHPRLRTVGGPSGAFASRTGARRFQTTQTNAEPDFYKVLGVPRLATENDIRKQYFKVRAHVLRDIRLCNANIACWYHFYSTFTAPFDANSWLRSTIRTLQDSAMTKRNFIEYELRMKRLVNPKRGQRHRR